MAEEPRLLTVPQVAERMQLSVNKVWTMVTSGVIRSVTIGRSRRIPVEAVEEYIASILEEQAG